MHVVLIHQAFVGPGEPGGTRHLELASRAVHAGHRFTVVASDVSYLTGRMAPRPEEVIPGVTVLRAWTPKFLHRSFLFRVVAFLGFMVSSVRVALGAGKVDLVFGTSPPMPQVFSAWLVSVIRRVPFVLEIRDLWPEFAIGMGVLRNRLLITVARAMEGFLYARASLIVVNSPAYHDYLVGKGIGPDKIRLVPNGVDAAMFDPDRDGSALRREWGGADRFVALYAGALGQANDIPTLLAAAELLRNDTRIRIVLVGDGKERTNLEAEARRRDLSNVLFAGALPKERMPEALAAADACIAILQDIPMFRTTYPNKVFDYMAAARPTVLAIDGVIRKVVEEAGGGIFVPPGDAERLAEAVRGLAADPDRSRKMGASARDFVVRNFNRDEQAGLFVGALEQAVGTP
jgi:glycosyltransferase involved in cell wall biosynthesis